MSPKLPNTLLEAESIMHESIIHALKESSIKNMSVNLLFQNIRLNPIIFRLCKKLIYCNFQNYIVWLDEGGTALAKRDLSDFSESIYSYNSFTKLDNIDNNRILIIISPQPYDFEQLKNICEIFMGRVIIFNGKLEDTAIGIGNVGRERRKEFINLMKYIFWLQPFNRGAILKEYNSKWNIFRLDSDGYRFSNSFRDKPNEEMILESL